MGGSLVSRWPRCAAILLILALTSATTGEDLHAQFATRVNQVEVYATVTDPSGKAVKDLPREAFTIFEDARPEPITTFTSGEFPAAVALAIDRSVSMAGKPLTMARTAGRAFIGSLKPGDRAMLIGVSGEVEVLAPLSADKGPILAALTALDAWSTTALHDALIRSLDLLEGEPGRRAIVLLSDGTDRYSHSTAPEVLDRARRSDVLIYPIAIGKARPSLFAELAVVSGGQSFHLKDPQELTPTLNAIADDLRSQYLIGYAPSEAWPLDSKQWRSITVRVNQPGLRVRARSGYSTR
jgi:Ca-activated chloride channel homolog